MREENKPKEQSNVHNTLSYLEIKNRIHNIGSNDFADAATGHRRLFVLFNSASDPENLRTMRGFFGAYQRLIQKDLNLTWGVVDCDSEKSLCLSQDIFYTPRTFLYINKKRVNYTEGRSTSLVSNWIVTQIRHPGIHIDRRPELKWYEDNFDRFFFYIGYMDEDFEIFKELAASNPHYTWISCFDRDRNHPMNGIYWYENSNRSLKAQDMINSPHGGGVMVNFTLKYFGTLRNAADYSLERLFMHDQVAIVLIYPDHNEERGIQMPFWSASQDWKWEILSFQIPMHLDQPNVVHLNEFLGITNPQSSAMRIVHHKNGKWEIYQMRERMTSESMLKFWKDWKAGKLPKFYKSDKPMEHRSNEVRKLVGKNYRKYLFDHEHDAVVIFHSVNCTVCERLLKIGKIAVHILSRYADLRIYEINTWLNAGEDIPDRNAPQVRLYAKHDKLNPRVFAGLYTAKDLVAWIADTLGKENPFDEEMQLQLKKRQQKADSEQDI